MGNEKGQIDHRDNQGHRATGSADCSVSKYIRVILGNGHRWDSEEDDDNDKCDDDDDDEKIYGRRPSSLSAVPVAGKASLPTAVPPAP